MFHDICKFGTQSLSKMVVAVVVVVFVNLVTFASFNNLLVISTIKRLPAFIFGWCPKMSMATRSSAFVGETGAVCVVSLLYTAFRVRLAITYCSVNVICRMWPVKLLSHWVVHPSLTTLSGHEKKITEMQYTETCYSGYVSKYLAVYWWLSNKHSSGIVWEQLFV